MNNHDVKEYIKNTSELIVPNITRAVVVSLDDPLRAGRVQVWIPTLHGMFGDDGDNSDGTNANEDSKQLLDNCAAYARGIRDGQGVSNTVLPWAAVMGFGWGPTGSTVDGTSFNAKHGVMAIPRVGTEVYVAFEQDDPELPIIIGTIFHQFEAMTMVPDGLLELAPGVRAISTQNVEGLTESTYDAHISDVYIVKSDKGKTLLMSDIAGREEMSLFTSIGYNRNSEVDGSPTYKTYQNSYPMFPSTATASRIARVSSTTTSPLVTLKEKPPEKHPDGARRLPFTIKAGARSSGQEYGAPRDGGKRKHAGIDYSIPKGSNVVAPIDGVVMAMNNSTTSSAGRTLYLRGIDNSIHTFMHLDSIEPPIVSALNRGGQVNVGIGTIIAKSGNTGIANNGSTYSAHLHWDVCKTPDDVPLIETRADLLACRGAMFRGGKYQQHVWGGPSHMNPEEWLKGGKIIQAEPCQLGMYANSVTYDSTSERYLGLQVVTSPGAESIALRHSSGSYINIDLDGNINMFSVGDINIRSNRSMHIQLIGGFIMNCLAGFIRAKSVWQTMSLKLRTLGIWSADWSKWPKVMKRMEESMFADMNDMLRYSTENVTATYRETASPLSSMATGTPALTTLSKPPVRTLTNNRWDALIKSKHASIIASSDLPEQMKKELSTKFLKALMLIESNGDENAKSSANARGLFQITPITAKDITGDSDTSKFIIPDANADIACRLLVKNCSRLLKELKAEVTNGTLSSGDVLCLVLASYNMGITAVSNNIKTVRHNGRTPTYAQVEHLWSGNDETKNFIPSVLYLRDRVTI